MQTLVIVILVIAVLYLLAIMPRMTGKPDQSIFKTPYFAHRGLHDNHSQAPENSLPAFAKAVEAGYGMELDVQTSKDGVPVVFHDFTLRRVCGVPGKVGDYTLAELKEFRILETQQRIPTFAEVLKLVDGRAPLIVELKEEATDLSVCSAVEALLKDYKGQYCIESFNPLILFWYRRHHSKVVRGQLSDNYFQYPEYRNWKEAGLIFLEYLITNFITKPDFIAYNHTCQGNLSRKLCHGLYRNTAAAWTIQSQEELEKARGHFDVFIFDSFLPS